MPPLLILGMKVLGGLIGLTLVADELEHREREGREAGYKHGYWDGSIQTGKKLAKKAAEKDAEDAEKKKRIKYAVKLVCCVGVLLGAYWWLS